MVGARPVGSVSRNSQVVSGHRWVVGEFGLGGVELGVARGGVRFGVAIVVARLRGITSKGGWAAAGFAVGGWVCLGVAGDESGEGLRAGAGMCAFCEAGGGACAGGQWGRGFALVVVVRGALEVSRGDRLTELCTVVSLCMS